jgi:hypothetical protein
MDTQEAKHILSKALNNYRARQYAELLHLLSSHEISEITTDSGKKYQLEFLAIWDDQKEGNLRVMGSIDDGGIRAFMPLTDDFIIALNGKFIDE